jgi:hypothetical protein
MRTQLFIFRFLVALLLSFCFSIASISARAEEPGGKAPADLKAPTAEAQAPSISAKAAPDDLKAGSVETKTAPSDLKAGSVETKTAPGDLKEATVELKTPPADLNDWAAVRTYGLSKLDAGKLKAAAKYLNMAHSLAEKKSIHSDEFLSSSEDLARLDEARGRYWQASGGYNQVFTELSQKPNSEANVKVAVLQADIGRLNYLLGDLPQARMQLEKALVAFNKLNDQSLEKARALRDLCQVHLEYGLFGRARSEAKQALALSEKLAGSKSLDACESLISLAKTEMFTAQLDQAELYIRQALAIPVDNSRKVSLERANCLDACAQIYLDEGRSAQALTLEEEALAIRQKLCGEDHPATLECLMTLAIISIAQKDYDSAKVFLEKGMAIAQDRFGQDSAKAARVLAIQATCAKSKGSSDDAKTNFTKASEIANKLSVVDNPVVKNLRDLTSGSSDAVQSLWPSKKSEDNYPLDPLSRCISCLLTKGQIDRPIAPKQTEPEPEETQTIAQSQTESQAQAPATTSPQKAAPFKLKMDWIILFGLATIIIPVMLFVVFSKLSAPKTTVNRLQRRGSAKGQEAAPTNESSETTGDQDGSGQLMSRHLDGNKVNKFWDINQ